MAQKYARVVDGVVFETWTPPTDQPDMTPVDAFGSDLGSTFVPCADQVDQRWTYSGTKFAAPKAG